MDPSAIATARALVDEIYVDEQIKRSDGQLVTKQKEAEAYCH